MRVLLDIVESLTSSIRFVVGMVVLAMLAIGLMFTLGATYVAPQAIDSMAERAQTFGEKAIEAEREERRAADLADDGWSYDSATGSSSSDAEDGYAATGEGWAR
jgi:hypothetical protein